MKFFAKPTDSSISNSNSKRSRLSFWSLGMVSLALFFLYSCIQSVPGDVAQSEKAPAMSEMKDMKGEAAGEKSPETAEKPGEGADENKGTEEDLDVALQAAADHEALFAESRYPSAATCGTCHPQEYKEWSVSQHSYAQLSPVYLSLSSEINELSSGSNGDFCLRCHSPIGANLGESPFMSNLDRHPTSREGITCVVCHRMNKDYNKRSGRLALVEGSLLAPVYGPQGNEEMARVLKDEEFRVVTEEGKPGRKVHTEVKKLLRSLNLYFVGLVMM